MSQVKMRNGNLTNGFRHNEDLQQGEKAEEVSELLKAVQELLIPFIQQSDDKNAARNGGSKVLSPVVFYPPQQLKKLLKLELPESGAGKDGILDMLKRILKYSVNTWDQGYMDKLASGTNAIGVVSDLILSVLDTPVHTYQVSPALTIIEKATSQKLARSFGLNGDFAGGVTQPGGSASNATSLVVARNTLFPSSKVTGNGTLRLKMFTSVNSHYSISKAAMMCGLGTSNLHLVSANKKGQMDTIELELAVQKAMEEGFTPFYVCATAGTTVLGAFDSLSEISAICQKYKMWMHVDASWGGSLIFSPIHQYKLAGAEFADSITVTPNKMLRVPGVCSFLLGADIRKFHAANSLEADYLFHEDWKSAGEVWDMADLTLQCSRRGDSLKLALGWIYYGTDGYAKQIEDAFEVAAYLASLVQASDQLVLVSENPAPCLQVCFYFRGNKTLSKDSDINTKFTKTIVKKLLGKGYMVDYAPGDFGCFFRAVVHVRTEKRTVEILIRSILELAGELQ